MARLNGLEIICAGPVPGQFSRDVFLSVYPMWLGMTAAMMLPTLVPTLRAYDDLIVSVGPSAGADRLGWLGIVAGFFAVWAFGSVGFAIAQTGLAGLGLVDHAGVAQLGYIAAALLVIAGLWQFTSTKEHCRDACLSPAAYFIGRWRPGITGALRMGAGLGMFCIGCCWALMLLMFIVGTGSIGWMLLLGAVMAAEKNLPGGRVLAKPLGGVLLAGAVIVAFQNHATWLS